MNELERLRQTLRKIIGEVVIQTLDDLKHRWDTYLVHDPFYFLSGFE